MGIGWKSQGSDDEAVERHWCPHKQRPSTASSPAKRVSSKGIIYT
jgi:hypothetical protein